MTSYAPMIRQLRAMLTLTQTEAQIARIRIAQARTDAVRRELSENASNADRRTREIADELRTLGGVPDVVSPLLGRFTGLVKSAMEQAAPFDEALLQDLRLEQQLQGRARYLRTLARTANRRSTEELAQRLESAHTATVDWITTVLAEEALGGPAALRATPLQRVTGGATRLANVPVRFGREAVNQVADRFRRTAGHARDTVSEVSDRARETVSEVSDRARDTVNEVSDRARDTVNEVSDRASTIGRDTKDALTTGRDAALRRAESNARGEGATDTARGVRTVRREVGALDSSELPIPNYDQLGVQEAIRHIKELDRTEDIRTVVRYEETHKDRSNVVSAAQTRMAAIAKEVAGVRN